MAIINEFSQTSIHKNNAVQVSYLRIPKKISKTLNTDIFLPKKKQKL